MSLAGVLMLQPSGVAGREEVSGRDEHVRSWERRGHHQRRFEHARSGLGRQDRGRLAHYQALLHTAGAATQKGSLLGRLPRTLQTKRPTDACSLFHCDLLRLPNLSLAAICSKSNAMMVSAACLLSNFHRWGCLLASCGSYFEACAMHTARRR